MFNYRITSTKYFPRSIPTSNKLNIGTGHNRCSVAGFHVKLQSSSPKLLPETLVVTVTIVAIVRRSRCLTGTTPPSMGARRCHLAAVVSGDRSVPLLCLCLTAIGAYTDSLLWPKIRKERGRGPGLLLRKRSCYTGTRKLYLTYSEMEMIAPLAWSFPAALHKWVGPVYRVFSIVRCSCFIFCSKNVPSSFLIAPCFFFVFLEMLDEATCSKKIWFTTYIKPL